jgi:hypothetical protein
MDLLRHYPDQYFLVEAAEGLPDTVRTSMNWPRFLVALGRFEAERLAGLARR